MGFILRKRLTARRKRCPIGHLRTRPATENRGQVLLAGSCLTAPALLRRDFPRLTRRSHSYRPTPRRTPMTQRVLPAVALFGTFFIFLAAGAAEPAKPDAAQVEFFEKQVRPVLVAHCIKCH